MHKLNQCLLTRIVLNFKLFASPASGLITAAEKVNTHSDFNSASKLKQEVFLYLVIFCELFLLCVLEHNIPLTEGKIQMHLGLVRGIRSLENLLLIKWVRENDQWSDMYLCCLLLLLLLLQSQCDKMIIDFTSRIKPELHLSAKKHLLHLKQCCEIIHKMKLLKHSVLITH